MADRIGALRIRSYYAALIIVLGDLNADCDYFDEEDLLHPLRRMD